MTVKMRILYMKKKNDKKILGTRYNRLTEVVVTIEYLQSIF